MFSNDFIIKTIETDKDFTECGEYYQDFMKGSPDMRYEYAYPCELREALASPEKETCWFARLATTTITVVADDNTHLLVKEILSDWNGSRLQWWLLDKTSFIGDIVWENDDR